MQIMELLFVRLIVAFLLAFMAFNDFFATAGSVAYRMGALGVAEQWGRLTPGDDYQRLIPLMEAVPIWLHGLWVLAGGLYLAAIALLARRKGSAHILVLAALGIEVVAQVLGRPIIEATGVVVNPNPSLLATIVIPFVLPLSVAFVLWQDNRKTSASMGV